MHIQIGDIVKLRDRVFDLQEAPRHYLILQLRQRTFLTICLEDGKITPIQKHFARQYAEKAE
jgi:hypothetical protein